MRVGVLFRGFPVRRPSRVADTYGAVECFLLERLLKIGKFADTAPNFNLLALQHRDAGRVVASIFQLGETTDQNRHRLLIAHVSDNSTHGAVYLRFFDWLFADFFDELAGDMGAA